jgi:hypothetical protein
MEPDTYLTIKSFSQGLYKEKGSRFIALAYPVTTQEEIKSILQKIGKEHHSARHHCFAWMLGQSRQTYRVNDDGEPSGSAGKPILGQINSFQVTNVLIVVYGAINDVMKIIKDDDAGQSQQKFELECRMIINFRTSARDRILNALSRIDGLKYRHTDTF